jgi:hypothetical protein
MPTPASRLEYFFFAADVAQIPPAIHKQIARSGMSIGRGETGMISTRLRFCTLNEPLFLGCLTRSRQTAILTASSITVAASKT